MSSSVQLHPAASPDMRRMTVEVKIGVQYAAREIVVESGQTPAAVEALITAAVKDGGLLILADERGRHVLIPVEKLAYVEIGEATERRVGFGTM